MNVSAFPTYQYYFGVDAGTHQANWNRFSADGFRMIDVSVQGAPTTAKYAAVWVKDSARIITAARHGLNQAQYEQASRQLASQGLIPTWVSVTGTSVDAIFAGIWQTKTDCNSQVILSVPATDVPAKVEDFASRGMQTMMFQEYGSPADRRFAMLVKGCPYVQKVNTWINMDTATHQQIFDAEISKPFWRTLSVTGSAQGTLAATYSDLPVGKWRNFANINANRIKATVDTDCASNGMFPISLQAYGSASAPLYSVICVENYPVSKSWRTQTGANTIPGGTASAIDTAVESFMRKNSIRHAQVALGRQGTLLYEKAYTYAEAFLPTASPSHKFLLASVSKAFCAAAVQALYDRRNLRPEQKAYPALGLTDFSADARLKDITVQQLLDHRAGMNRTAAGFDTVFQARQIAQDQSNNARVATVRDMVDWMVKKPLFFKPGSAEEYDNYGYVLLSYLVELRGNSTRSPKYFDVLKELVLDPNGLDVVSWKTASNAHGNDPIKQEDRGWGANALTPASDKATAAVYGGDGMVKEIVEGPSSLACSASTLVRFLRNHAVWGNGGRGIGRRDGLMSGSRTTMSSRAAGLDWAFVVNNRDYPEEEWNNVVNKISGALDGMVLHGDL